MTTNNPTLKEMLIEDLPPGLVSELIANMDLVYEDSYAAMFEDPGLGEDQAKAILGHYRRGCVETLLSRTAIKHGLKPIPVQPSGGGCSHVSVLVGRFELVICHVVSSDAFPQHSDEREQSSKVNECIAQMNLFNEKVTPESGEFYGIIIHSEISGKKNKFGSIKIGFPSHVWGEWAEAPIDMIEISEIQSKTYQKPEDLQGQIQNEKAKPKLKLPRSTSKEIKDRGA